MLVFIGGKWEGRSIRVRKSDEEMIGDDYLWVRIIIIESKGINFLRESMKFTWGFLSSKIFMGVDLYIYRVNDKVLVFGGYVEV